MSLGSGRTVQYRQVDGNRHAGLLLPDGTRMDSLRLSELRSLMADHGFAVAATSTKDELLDQFLARFPPKQGDA